MSKVAQLGCIVCKQMGYPDTPCELHHIKDRRGMSKKSSDYEVIGLCYLHHRGDQGYHHSPKKFTERFGTQKELLQKVLTYVNCCGGCEYMYVLSLGHFSPCCIIHFSREDIHILMGQ